MIKYYKVKNNDELHRILDLQQRNLMTNIDIEKHKQGFVVFQYDIDLLDRLNKIESNIIAKDEQKVVAYLLVATKESKNLIPNLKVIYDQLESSEYNGKKIKDYNYISVFQTAIDHKYRNKGIFKECYSAYHKMYHLKYDLAITAVPVLNTPFVNAHHKLGFIEIGKLNYLDTDFVLMLWDWKNANKEIEVTTQNKYFSEF